MNYSLKNSSFGTFYTILLIYFGIQLKFVVDEMRMAPVGSSFLGHVFCQGNRKVRQRNS